MANAFPQMPGCHLPPHWCLACLINPFAHRDHRSRFKWMIARMVETPQQQPSILFSAKMASPLSLFTVHRSFHICPAAPRCRSVSYDVDACRHVSGGQTGEPRRRLGFDSRVLKPCVLSGGWRPHFELLDVSCSSQCLQPIKWDSGLRSDGGGQSY